MLGGVPHDLRRGIKAHRLGVQQGRAKHIRVMAFQPGRGIGDQRKGRRMAFRETVTAKALELLERVLGKNLLIAIGDHAIHQLVPEMADAACTLKVAIERRSWSASIAVNPAHSMATRIACSWNSGTPSVLPSTFSSSGLG